MHTVVCMISLFNIFCIDTVLSAAAAVASAAAVSPPSAALAVLGEDLQDILYSALAVLLEFAVLGRIFLVPILAERNEVLAESILAECRREKLRQNQQEDISGRAVVAVLGSHTVPSLSSPQSISLFFLSVLSVGMAHCNGIKRIMTARNVE